MGITLPNFASVGFNDPQAVGGLPSFPKESAVAAGEAAFGAGLAKAGQGIQTIDAYGQIAKNKMDRAMADANWFANAAEIDGDLKAEADINKLPEIKARYRQAAETAANAFSDPGARKMWLLDQERHVVAGEKGAQMKALGLYRDNYHANLLGQSDAVVKAGVNDDDPRAFEFSVNRIKELAESGAQAGVLTPVQAHNYMRAGQQNLIVGRVGALVNKGRAAEASTLIDSHADDLEAVAPGTVERLRHQVGVEQKKAQRKALIDHFLKDDGTDTPGISSGGAIGQRVSQAAAAEGVSDRLALTTAQIESGLGKAPDRPGSQYKGVFQLGNAAAASVGGREVEHGVKFLKNTKDQLAGALGREPDDWEVYLAHQQGVGGASKLLANPDKPAGDLLPPQNIKGNGGDPSAPASQFTSHWRDTFNRTALGLGRKTEQPAAAAAQAAIPGSQPLMAGASIGEASGQGQPKDVDAGTAPLPDIEAKLNRVQEMADRGDIDQEDANAVSSALRSNFNRAQARQANERAALAKSLTDGGAALLDGREYDYSPAQVRHYFSKEKSDEILQQLDDAKEGGQLILGQRLASPDQIAQQRSQLEAGLNDPNAANYAKRRRMVTLFDEGLAQRAKALIGEHADPAGYVARYSPHVAGFYAAVDPKEPASFANYAQATLAEQARLGVPEERRAILPKEQASATAARIAAIDPAKDIPGQAMSELAKSYGAGTSHDYWPQVFGDLVKAKLPGTYQVLASMDHPAQQVASEDLSRAIKIMAEKGGMSILKKAVPDETQKAIDKNIDTTLEDFRLSTGNQMGGEDLYNRVRDSVQALSYYYGFQGKNESAAVQQAIDGILNAKYDFGRIGDTTVRVPKGQMSVVDHAAAVVQNNLTAADIGPIPGNQLLTPEQRKEIWLGAIRNGSWVNNENDTGIVLMGRFQNNQQRAVQRADGSRIEVKFANAPALAASAAIAPIPPSPDVPLQAIQ